MMINPSQVRSNVDRTDNRDMATSAATSLYGKVSRQAWWGALQSRMAGHAHSLLALDTVTTSGRREHYAGLQQVEIARIRGSEGRLRDFDKEFRPLQEHTQERWLSVARAMMMGVPLPPVELLQVDDIYFVRDGHHRISVAKARGQAFIEAHVIRLEGGERTDAYGLPEYEEEICLAA